MEAFTIFLMIAFVSSSFLGFAMGEDILGDDCTCETCSEISVIGEQIDMEEESKKEQEEMESQIKEILHSHAEQ